MSERFVSPCCGAECKMTEHNAAPQFYVCARCASGCEPIRASVRARIVAEGMRKAADICKTTRDTLYGSSPSHGKGCNECEAAIRAAALREERP